MTTYAGAPMKRFEDPQLVQGKGSFVDDKVLPGMLHAAVLRSPHAYALIRSIDTSKAEALPGVVQVVTSADIPGLETIPPRQTERLDDMKSPRHPVLAEGKVCYVGQAVAAVLAESRYVARDALELIQVDYEPLRPVMDPYEAVSPDSKPIHEDIGSNVAVRMQVGRGDVDVALAESDKVIRERFHVPRLAPNPMEGRALIADYQPGNMVLELWTSTQVPHKAKSFLGPLLKRPDIHLRVLAPDVGGGFGQKVELWPEEILFSHLAIQIERPIKWIEDRWENVLAYQARGYHGEVEAGVKSDGTILGMRFRMIADLGGYYLTSTAGPAYNTIRRVNGPYAIPNMDVSVDCVITNRPPTGPYRGAGAPEGAFMMERTLDLIAQELDMDPAEVRRQNFVADDAFPYTTGTGLIYDSGQFGLALDRALEMGEYSRYREAQRNRKPGDPLIGIGVSTVVKASGGIGEMRDSAAVIQVDASGAVRVHTEVSPHGQGTETTFSQMAADELGLTPEDLTILHSDTAVIARGGGTSASRGTVVSGSAMVLALRQAREKMERIAAQLLDCPTDDLEFQDGRVSRQSDPSRATTFADVASAAYEEERLPQGEDIGLDFSLDYTLPNNPYAFGAHVAVVEVEPDTGDVRIIKYFAVHDCGRIINPVIVEAQMHGGIVQGLGQAMVEGIEYDSSGQLITGSLLDYSLPVAADMPDFQMDTMETPSPLTPHGAKGIGELPTVAAPVVLANAVMNALASAGVRNVDTPLTPSRVMEALMQAD
jgi:carbon-monoxide dehydrogenase large subunit